MKILHLNASDTHGGASRAAYRIHRCLVDHLVKNGVQSRMQVLEKGSDDTTVESRHTPLQSNFIWNMLPIRVRQFPRRGFRSPNPTLYSIAWPSTGLGDQLVRHRRQQCFNLLHLHWLGDSTLSIEEIGSLPHPVVWTLHDQWAFCGAEHYTAALNPRLMLGESERFVTGYHQSSRPVDERGPDLNRRTWLRKQRAWRRPMHIVCPSNWLADCARRSELMQSWPITVVPYPIDLTKWAPLERDLARSLLGLPLDIPLVLFGAFGGTSDPRKGSDLLFAALQYLSTIKGDSSLSSLNLVVFGQSSPPRPPSLGFPIHYTGPVQDDLRLRLLYASADVFVIPSRVDNLPNTGLEAHACGTPVVAFNTCGLPDIVDDRVTGALADPFDALSLAQAIRWVLEDSQRSRILGLQARARAELLWNPSLIARQYLEVYNQAFDAGDH